MLKNVFNEYILPVDSSSDLAFFAELLLLSSSAAFLLFPFSFFLGSSSSEESLESLPSSLESSESSSSELSFSALAAVGVAVFPAFMGALLSFSSSESELSSLDDSSFAFCSSMEKKYDIYLFTILYDIYSINLNTTTILK